MFIGGLRDSAIFEVTNFSLSFFFRLMFLCYLCTHNFIRDYPMAKKNEIIVKDVAIKTMSKDGIDYISITDIARQKNATDPNGVIANWMRNRNTVEFLGIWETLHNPNFNPLEFEGFRKEAGLNAFTLSPTRWIEATNAIGIVSQAGRYGGTFAQTDITKGLYLCTRIIA